MTLIILSVPSVGESPEDRERLDAAADHMRQQLKERQMEHEKIKQALMDDVTQQSDEALKEVFDRVKAELRRRDSVRLRAELNDPAIRAAKLERHRAAVEEAIPHVKEAPAHGTVGCLLYDYSREKFFFRVYDRTTEECKFVDYDIRHDDPEFMVVGDDAAFFTREGYEAALAIPSKYSSSGLLLRKKE